MIICQNLQVIQATAAAAVLPNPWGTLDLTQYMLHFKSYVDLAR